MTNETTASQPKSIGDDAHAAFERFVNLPSKPGAPIWHAFHAGIEWAQPRAPADQASATIQAATLPAERAPNSSDPRDEAHAAGWNACLAEIRSAATIQEPVMVAEPVGEVKPYSCETGQIDEALADFLAEHTRLNQDGIDTHAMNMTLALNYAAITPTPDEEIARWREQGYLPDAAPMVADPAGVDRDGRMSDELRKMIEGMSVSVDVSTGDDDAGNRYFGTVNEVMDGYHGEKHGVMLLIQDPEPNFDLAATVKTVPSEALEDAGWFGSAETVPSSAAADHEAALEAGDFAEAARIRGNAAPPADKTGGGE